MIVLNSILIPEVTEPCGKMCDDVQECVPRKGTHLLELTSMCFTGSRIQRL